MKKTKAFHLLASADRQLILHELVNREGEASVDELSQQVAARRHRISPETISSNKIERAKVRLVHTHLRQLVGMNIINVDWNEKTVAFSNDEETDRLFEAAEELESWPPDDFLESPYHN
ncbi:hypothetical protein Htur_4539 (plasmid) [Haloterrigena turkmenica DSM 5511]|uniref:DUF7344 domain-containing protein n=1 Tax=Haloterrigena turkmenica (strain ATCC 51198 / DSM 5511 / JCM 9101 / NCIMB 13204 / VKM B-1734 / 4k) TaxID=543526 RepID=D2S1U6_HALTV|nr:hypothetical protein [Haloterrigena turkmenica]ADB63343.1 hypothetical protein Htur_4539 [Haloterrigena turkmenica DSM 5511]